MPWLLRLHNAASELYRQRNARNTISSDNGILPETPHNQQPRPRSWSSFTVAGGSLLFKKNNHAVYAAHLIHPEFLNGIGANHAALSDYDLLEVFADTFLLDVLSQTREFGNPFPEVDDKTKRCCFEYISSISFPEKRSG